MPLLRPAVAPGACEMLAVDKVNQCWCPCTIVLKAYQRGLFTGPANTLSRLLAYLWRSSFCARKHITLSRGGTGETRQRWWKGLSISPPHPNSPSDRLASPCCQMIIGTETLFFWSKSNSVCKLQHGKNMNGTQVVWCLSHRGAKSCSLWLCTKGKCSVDQHCYFK